MSSTNMSVSRCVRDIFSRSVEKSFPGVSKTIDVAISPSKFGDYQCNSAFQIVKSKDKSPEFKLPLDVATALKNNITEADADTFDSIVVSKPGFVTVNISRVWIEKNLKFLLKEGIKSSFKTVKRERIVVDLSSPNVAKEMHVGHLRSTIIGDSICRILEYVGHDVLRLNHVGDWGTQFGMLIEQLKRKENTNDNTTTSACELQNLQQFYREAKSNFDRDPDFRKASQLNVVKLQGGDLEALATWRDICHTSRIEFQKLYIRLDINLEERGESFYNNDIVDIVRDLKNKGLLVDSDGAKCVFTSIDDVPLMAVKSDGGFGYDTTDLAAIRQRLNDEKANRIIYVVDSGQESHFLKLFEVARKAGWVKTKDTRLDFVGFGVILGEDGKKFKTRSGDVVKLVSLLDESKKRAAVEITTRRSEESAGVCVLRKEGSTTASHDIANDDICVEDIENSSEIIGISAIKYFDLKQNRLTDYKFSYERMLDPKGNTAVYLLYAYARINAIFRKLNFKMADTSIDDLEIEKVEERNLGLAILRFYEVVEEIVKDLHINRLTDFVFDLSCKFTDFYRECRVLGDDKQKSRLLLCEATRVAMETSFNLLGMKTLSRI